MLVFGRGDDWPTLRSQSFFFEMSAFYCDIPELMLISYFLCNNRISLIMFELSERDFERNDHLRLPSGVWRWEPSEPEDHLGCFQFLRYFHLSTYQLATTK